MAKKKEIKKYLHQNLNEARRDHVLRVTKTALKLGKKFGSFSSKEEKKKTLKKIEKAALLHDCEKQTDLIRLWSMIQKEPPVKKYHIRKTPSLWHAFAAAISARERFDIVDEDILNAVRFHTTGRRDMSFIEKVIYLADAIEPGRNYDGEEDIRKASKKSLEEGCLKALEVSMNHVREKGAVLSELSNEAWRDLKHGK